MSKPSYIANVGKNGRTYTMEYFTLLRDAREYMESRAGYITRIGDAGTAAADVSFVRYFGGFEPSATEADYLRGVLGYVPQTPAETERERWERLTIDQQRAEYRAKRAARMAQ